MCVENIIKFQRILNISKDAIAITKKSEELPKNFIGGTIRLIRL